MASIKCPRCGLINFPDAEVCRRCQLALPIWPEEPVVEPLPPSPPPLPSKRPGPFVANEVKIGIVVSVLALLASLWARSNEGEAADTILILLGVVGGLAILAGSVLLVMAAFRESVLWGLGVLLVPFVGLVFVFVHWDASKRPIVIQTVGAALLLFALFGARMDFRELAEATGI